MECAVTISSLPNDIKREENEENKIKERTSRKKVEGRKSKIKAFYVAHGSLKYVNKQSPQMWQSKPFNFCWARCY